MLLNRALFVMTLVYYDFILRSKDSLCILQETNSDMWVCMSFSMLERLFELSEAGIIPWNNGNNYYVILLLHIGFKHCHNTMRSYARTIAFPVVLFVSNSRKPFRNGQNMKTANAGRSKKQPKLNISIQAWDQHRDGQYQPQKSKEP